jgi:hypothetical protein
MSGFDLLLAVSAMCAIIVLAYDFIVSAATVHYHLQDPRPSGIFGWLDRVGGVLDPIAVFVRQASVSLLVLAVVALLKLLEVHP